MKQIKNSFLRKKSESTDARSVTLKNPDEMKTVLLISNAEGKTIKRKVEELFPNASIYHLFPREIKEDRTVGFYYSVHKTDFNLTGNLKNDKLNNLLKMKVDLLLDLSFGSEQLNYFVGRINALLKVGDMNSNKVPMYDLFVEFGTTEQQSVELIYKHLNTLTQNTHATA